MLWKWKENVVVRCKCRSNTGGEMIPIPRMAMVRKRSRSVGGMLSSFEVWMSGRK